MSDLIDRDFAIKALDSAIDDFDDYHENYGIERAQSIISCLPSAQPRWIPRSEKLPEEDSRVLTTIQLPHCKRYVISSDYLRHTFYNDNGDCWMDDDEEVLAWMPLTNPWEGKEHEDRLPET